MNDNDFYKSTIIAMVSKLENTGWLSIIYSFVKVFAERSDKA